MSNFNERINLNIDLSIISKDICFKYNLGDFISNEVVEFGYEDFNYVLDTSTGKYFIKIFNKERIDNQINDYVEKIKMVSVSEVSFPKLISNNLLTLNINNIEYKLCVFNYIDGQNYFVMHINLSDEEIKEIARQIVSIQKIDIKPTFIYDTWAIVNFFEEFEKKNQYLDEKDYNKLNDLFERFKMIALDKLPQAFVHGDIRSTNIMRDRNNKIWIIDFAVSNYSPRIIDLAVAASDLCLIERDKEETHKRINILLEEYQKYFELTDYEKENFQLFFELSCAMNVLQASYQRAIGNDSKENDYWLNKGKSGLIL